MRRGWLFLVLVAVIWTVGVRWVAARHARPHHSAKGAKHALTDDQRRLVALVPKLACPARTLDANDVSVMNPGWVIALLRAGRTPELDVVLGAAEAQFERDRTRERDIETLFDAFSFASTSELPILNGWVARTPRSFVGYVARAAARVADPRGYGKKRGTTAADVALARADLEKAIELRPGLVEAYTLLLRMSADGDGNPDRGLLDRALAACEECLGPRWAYAGTLRPNCSAGDRDSLADFAKESQQFAGENPALRALLGYVDSDDCRRLRAEDAEAALQACDRAVAIYPAPDFLRTQAIILFEMGRYDDSAHALTTVLAVNPYDESALVERARAYSRANDFEDAAPDIRLALKLDPEDSSAAELLQWFVTDSDVRGREGPASFRCKSRLGRLRHPGADPARIARVRGRSGRHREADGTPRGRNERPMMAAQRELLPLVSLRSLGKDYGGTPALHSLSAEIGAGEIVGLLGPNGAGKTTTMKLVLGLLKPTRGTATVNALDCTRDAREVKLILGYCPDEPAFFDFLTGRETVDFVANVRGLDRSAAWQRLEPLVTGLEFEKQLATSVGGYSHGTKKKLALLVALVHEPRVLLLDEPTNGLDPQSSAFVKAHLRGLAASGVAVVVSTHLLEMADGLCERFLVLDKGRLLADGTPDQVRARAGVPEEGTLEEAFLRLIR